MSGGAVNALGDLSIQNVAFRHNHAVNGGAVYVEGTTEAMNFVAEHNVAASRTGNMVETAHSLMPENGKKRDEDSEDGLELSPFWGIEKGAVLQEARCFNDSQLDTRRCQQVCTSLMHSIY